jgi:hypothetical protein
MTTTDHNTVPDPAATLLPWHEFAATYRALHATYVASIKDDDEDNARHDAQKLEWEALLAYPVTTAHQLAEKAELILADSWDEGAALGSLAADALMVAHGPGGRVWRKAVAAYEAQRDAYDPLGPTVGTEVEEQARWRSYSEAWQALITTPAPDAAALAYKVAAYVDLAHSEVIGDSSSNPDTLCRMLDDTGLPGSFAIVRFMQDAFRQAGLWHPCLSVGLNDTATAEPRGTGPDLRPRLSAMGALRTGGARMSPAGGASMRTAALATLAEAARYWVEAEALLTIGDPSNAQLDALNASRDRISEEAAAIPAETREGLRHKAQIIKRLEGLALRDDASMAPAGLGLLRSILDDLQREDVAA